MLYVLLRVDAACTLQAPTEEYEVSAKHNSIILKHRDVSTLAQCSAMMPNLKTCFMHSLYHICISGARVLPSCAQYCYGISKGI